MTKLYTNENFPLPVARELRELGHEVVTIQETGFASQRMPDDQVLNYAASRGMAVVTFNWKDFRRLHRQQPNHAGIVICKVGENSAGLAERIDAAVKKHAPLAGKLVKVYRVP